MNSAPLAVVAVLARALSACGPSAAESPETRVAPPPTVSNDDGGAFSPASAEREVKPGFLPRT